MKLSPLSQPISKALEYLNDGQIYLCIEKLKGFASVEPHELEMVKAVESTYFYMLRYLASTDDSTSITDDFARLQTSIREVMAIIDSRLAAHTQIDSRRGAQLRFQRYRLEETLQSVTGDYLAELERLRTDTDVLTDTGRRAGLERLANDIFMRIWADNCLAKEDYDLVMSLINDSNIPSYDRVLWTAAIGLGTRALLPEKRIAVLEGAHSAADNDVSAMAALWLVIIAAADAGYRKNILSDMEKRVPGDAAEVLAALVTALPSNRRDTLTAGEMQRLNDIGRRMSEAMANKPADADAAEYLSSVVSAEDNELLRKFSRMQMQGGDAFSRILGNIRHDPFFSRLGNWFVPFHTDNSALAPIVDGEGMALADIIAKIPSLCAGDKYALLLSMSGISGQMRGPALSQMVDQLYRINDNVEFREAIDSIASLPRSMTVMRHVQNLMRFVSSYPAINEVWPGGVSADGLADVAPEVPGVNLAAFAATLANAGQNTPAARIYDILVGREPSVENLRAAAANADACGNHNKAIELLAKALEQAPAERDIILALARQHMSIGQPGDAFTLLQPYFDDMKDDEDALQTYAYAAAETRRWAEAAEAFHIIDEKTKGNDKKLRHATAMALFANGDLYSATELIASMDYTGSVAETTERAMVAWFCGSKNEALNTLLEAAARDTSLELTSASINKLKERLKDSPAALVNPVAWEEMSFIPDILRFKLMDNNAGMPFAIF